MNGIQKYLIELALEAAREAAGGLIANGKLNPVHVAQSLEEFKQAVLDMDGRIASKVPCNLEYRGRQASRVTGALGEPRFFQPPEKS